MYMYLSQHEYNILTKTEALSFSVTIYMSRNVAKMGMQSSVDQPTRGVEPSLATWKAFFHLR